MGTAQSPESFDFRFTATETLKENVLTNIYGSVSPTRILFSLVLIIIYP